MMGVAALEALTLGESVWVKAGGKVLVDGVVVFARSAAGRAARRDAGELLGAALIKAGVTQGEGEVAHHIVAFGAPAAQEARDVLIRYGIDINNASNGVFLRVAEHQGLPHSKAYYTAVNDLLRTARSRDEALNILNDIGRQIALGTFP
jgi:antitoxin component of RelBE/YafQ-DinJ toxin-antitoxin module